MAVSPALASISARSSGERSASSREESHLPAMTSDHSGRGVLGTLVSALEAGAGEHAHGLAEADPPAPGLLLDLTPLVDDLRELVAIDLDPLALDQHQALAGRKQLFDLTVRKPLAVESQTDIEIQQRIHPQGGRRFAADRDRHPRPGPVPGAPPVGQAHHQSGLLVQRDLAQETMRLPGRPRQRMIHVARVDQLADERAFFRRPGEGRQQGEQLLPVLRLRRTP